MAMEKEEKVTEEQDIRERAEAAGQEVSGEEVKQEAEGTDKEKTSEETSGETSEEAEDPKKSKRIKIGFGEKKEKKEKKDKKDEMIAELNDKLLRKSAEFDNFRKRTEKEKTAMFETGAKSVIEKLLPVVDNFERGLATVGEEEAKSAFADGISKVYKQLMTELEKLEVKPIEAVGQEFDPNLHNAVMHVDDETVGDNVVVEELQKGYTYHGSVVRHSMVKVAN